jgi:hypothetical protein
MGKKYLETKEKSLESSVLGIWQEAAKKADELDEAKFSPKEIKMAIGVASDKRYAGGNMTGAVKAIEKMKKGLSDHPQVKAVLRRQNEAKLDPVNKKALKKDFDDRKDKDIDNDGDVDDSDKYLAKRRKAVSKAIAKEENELDVVEDTMAKVREFKIQDMKSALAQVWGMEEGKNPFKKEEEEKPVITKGGKTLTGKKPAEIDVKPKLKA